MGRKSRRKGRRLRDRVKRLPEPPPEVFPTAQSYLDSPYPSCARCGVPGPTVKPRVNPFWEVWSDLAYWEHEWCLDCFQEVRSEV